MAEAADQPDEKTWVLTASGVLSRGDSVGDGLALCACDFVKEKLEWEGVDGIKMKRLAKKTKDRMGEEIY